MPPTDPQLSQWFALEVQPHDAALRAYLRNRFPQISDPDDVVQETYTRLLREHAAGRVRHVRAFVFTAARNVALDSFRRRKIAAEDAVTHLPASDVVEPCPDAVHQLVHQEDLALLASALRTLPDRCRQVMLLRYLKGFSYKQIATLLQISPETVKTQLARGTARCAAHFARHGVIVPAITPAGDSD